VVVASGMAKRKRRRRAGLLQGYMSEARIKSCRVELRRCLLSGAKTPRLAWGVCKRRHKRCLDGARR
jgi:hypothetical protein